MDNYEITLRDNLRVMFKRARILIYFVIIALLSCYLFVSLCTPKYKSEVKLLVSGLPQVESPYYRQMTSFRTVDVATTISEVIKGRDFLRQVVLTLDLENREDEASFQTPLRKAFSFLYNRVKLATEGIQSLLGGKSGEEDKTEKAINYLSKNIDVESIERTDVVRVIAYDYNPQMAAKIADRLVKVFIIYNMQQQAFSYQSKYGEKHPRLVQLENEIKKMKNELNDEAGLTENWNRSNIKVINQAYVPTRPATPKKGLIFVVVIILSVIGGIIFVYILESLDHSFRSSRDVEKYMDIPLLATIPVYSSRKNNLIIHSIFFWRTFIFL